MTIFPAAHVVSYICDHQKFNYVYTYNRFKHFTSPTSCIFKTRIGSNFFNKYFINSFRLDPGNDSCFYREWHKII